MDGLEEERGGGWPPILLGKLIIIISSEVLREIFYENPKAYENLIIEYKNLLFFYLKVRILFTIAKSSSSGRES